VKGIGQIQRLHLPLGQLGAGRYGQSDLLSIQNNAGPLQKISQLHNSSFLNYFNQPKPAAIPAIPPIANNPPISLRLRNKPSNEPNPRNVEPRLILT